jgi:hypothetical protein
VDIGAYEFQSPASSISYAWLQQFGLATDGSADFADPDGDGMNNWQEWIAGTDPTSGISRLAMLNPTGSIPNLTLRWQSVTGRNYFVQRSSSLTAPAPFLIIATNVVGLTNLTSFTDTNATGHGPFFYRVGVSVP